MGTPKGALDQYGGGWTPCSYATVGRGAVVSLSNMLYFNIYFSVDVVNYTGSVTPCNIVRSCTVPVFFQIQLKFLIKVTEVESIDY